MSTHSNSHLNIESESEVQIPVDNYIESIVSENEDDMSVPPDYHISTYPADFTLEVLFQKWEAEDIVIPEFQRSFVWNQVKASKLIESFLVGIPVPAVFLYNERESQELLVIDGQQRLKSIFLFFKGFFDAANQRRRLFQLTGLHQDSKFSNKSFDDLQDEDKRRLKNAVLRAFVVQQQEPDDDTSMYHIFERLNTGSTTLTNQEIRNCLIHGSFVNFLKEINKEDLWRMILGKDQPDKRSKDIEILVRFFAMRDIDTYKKPMKEFLSQFMRRHRNDSEKKLGTMRENFTQTCETVIESLGERPFHVRRGLNIAVFDSVMAAFSKHLDNIPKDVSKRYNNLNKDEEFLQNTLSATTDVESIKTRFQIAESILFS